jgi:hydrogenase maturation protease
VRRRALIGIGNPWRRDDGVGVAVVQAVEATLPPDVEVAAVTGDLTRALSVWADGDPAVVVDGVRSGAPPGTISRLEADDLVAAGPAGGGLSSSHALGLADALAIGRAVGAVPRRLVVLNVEVAATAHGDQLSPAVAAAVPKVASQVRALLPPP